MTAEPRTTQRTIDTRDSLIAGAKRVFAQKGYDGASVKDLAESAGCNVSLVSYYFGGKEGLYRACLEEFGKDRLASAQRILSFPRTEEEFRIRLTLFLEEVLETHAKEPELSQILHREFDSGAENIQQLFKEVFFKVLETLVAFAEHGKKSGVIRKDARVEDSISLLLGGIIHTIRVENLARKFFGKTIQDPKHRRDLAENAVSLLLHGIANVPKSLQKPSKRGKKS